MHRFVITGGPCSGKTTIMSHLTQELEDRGYKVVIVPESATELILSGIEPSNEISMLDFQNFVLALQMAKEDLFSHAQRYYDSEKLVVLCDRGILDACAYVDKRNFEKLLAARGMNLAKVYSRYDAILHLVTAADGAEDFYVWNDPSKKDTGNNAARSESPAEARTKDKKTLDAWVGHPHLRMFDNETEFDGKIQRVLAEVFSILGEPLPTEKERKYLIKKPTPDELSKLGHVSEAQIVQTYLKSDDPKVERRIRQRGSKETGYSFYYTEKREIGYGEREEIEEIITATEYIGYLAEVDTDVHQISKTRYCFMYDQHYFELDVYPFSDEHAILEVELANIKEKFKMPPLRIVREVTCDDNFKNYNLAKTLTLEHDSAKAQPAAPAKKAPEKKAPESPKEKSAQEKKREPKMEPPKPASKKEMPKEAPKVEKKPEPVFEEPKPEPKPERKPEPKTEPKQEQRPATQPVETKPERPTVEKRPEPPKTIVNEPELLVPAAPVEKVNGAKEPELMGDLFGMQTPAVKPQENKEQPTAPVQDAFDDFDDLFAERKPKDDEKNKAKKPQDPIIDSLEAILNEHGYTAQYDYCIGGMSEQKVCLQQTNNKRWEVFVVEKGRKFDVTKHSDLVDAGIVMIRQLSTDRQECKAMIDQFKTAAGREVKPSKAESKPAPTTNDSGEIDLFADDLFDDFGQDEKPIASKKSSSPQKKNMSVEDFFSDLMSD